MKKIETDVLIVGAGPIGLFTVFELGQLGIKSCIVDSLSEIGGQCTALYPEKPIYDIPAYPEIKAEELIEKLRAQIKPFNPSFLLNQKVQSIIEKDKKFHVKTSNNSDIIVSCIVIAAGNGSFGPNKPPVENIDDFEDKTIFYHIKDKTIFKNKIIAIAGGGDSAVDWAIELCGLAKKIFFIHRRHKLRAAPNSVEKLEKLEKKGLLELVIPYQLASINGENGVIHDLVLKDLNQNKKQLKIDYFLPFFGLSTELGPIKNWELEIEKNVLKVDQSTCKTSREGIFAIGDICTYPGKLKLILTGFSEAAIASHNCFKRVFPDKVLHFEYSTSKGVIDLK